MLAENAGWDRELLALDLQYPTELEVDFDVTITVFEVADAILDCSKRRGVVLDAFAGSGTTLIAAEKAGRWENGIELDPCYCDVTS